MDSKNQEIITIDSTNTFPYGPLGINYTLMMNIDGKKWPSVANYLYSNLLTNTYHKIVLQNARIFGNKKRGDISSLENCSRFLRHRMESLSTEELERIRNLVNNWEGLKKRVRLVVYGRPEESYLLTSDNADQIIQLFNEYEETQAYINNKVTENDPDFFKYQDMLKKIEYNLNSYLLSLGVNPEEVIAHYYSGPKARKYFKKYILNYFNVHPSSKDLESVKFLANFYIALRKYSTDTFYDVRDISRASQIVTENILYESLNIDMLFEKYYETEKIDSYFTACTKAYEALIIGNTNLENILLSTKNANIVYDGENKHLGGSINIIGNVLMAIRNRLKTQRNAERTKLINAILVLNFLIYLRIFLEARQTGNYFFENLQYFRGKSPEIIISHITASFPLDTLENLREKTDSVEAINLYDAIIAMFPNQSIEDLISDQTLAENAQEALESSNSSAFLEISKKLYKNYKNRRPEKRFLSRQEVIFTEFIRYSLSRKYPNLDNNILEKAVNQAKLAYELSKKDTITYEDMKNSIIKLYDENKLPEILSEKIKNKLNTDSEESVSASSSSSSTESSSNSLMEKLEEKKEEKLEVSTNNNTQIVFSQTSLPFEEFIHFLPQNLVINMKSGTNINLGLIVDDLSYPSISIYINTYRLSTMANIKDNIVESRGISMKEAREYLIRRPSVDDSKQFSIENFVGPDEAAKIQYDVEYSTFLKLAEHLLYVANKEKFKNISLKELLLSTGDSLLVWKSESTMLGSGVDDKGYNLIGKSLMNTREILKSQPVVYETYEVFNDKGIQKQLYSKETFISWIKSRITDMCLISHKYIRYLALKDFKHQMSESMAKLIVEYIYSGGTYNKPIRDITFIKPPFEVSNCKAYLSPDITDYKKQIKEIEAEKEHQTELYWIKRRTTDMEHRQKYAEDTKETIKLDMSSLLSDYNAELQQVYKDIPIYPTDSVEEKQEKQQAIQKRINSLRQRLQRHLKVMDIENKDSQQPSNLVENIKRFELHLDSKVSVKRVIMKNISYINSQINVLKNSAEKATGKERKELYNKLMDVLTAASSYIYQALERGIISKNDRKNCEKLQEKYENMNEEIYDIVNKGSFGFENEEKDELLMLEQRFNKRIIEIKKLIDEEQKKVEKINKEIFRVYYEYIFHLIFSVAENKPSIRSDQIFELIIGNNRKLAMNQNCIEISENLNNLENCIASALLNIMDRITNLNTVLGHEVPMTKNDIILAGSILLSKDLAYIKDDTITIETINSSIEKKDNSPVEDTIIVEEEEEEEDLSVSEKPDEEDDEWLEFLDENARMSFGYKEIEEIKQKLAVYTNDITKAGILSSFFYSMIIKIRDFKMDNSIKINRINFFATH